MHTYARSVYNLQVHTDHPAPLWGGRFTDPADDRALELSSSLDVDLPLARYDIDGTLAHLDELTALGLLTAEQHGMLESALNAIAEQLDAGTFAWQAEHEDIHMNIEAAVIDAVGPELGGHLQAGRSRNEEVVSDERRWLRDASVQLDQTLAALQGSLLDRAAQETDTILPAHTHTQPAQPVLLAHHLLAYVEMLQRDRGRVTDAAARADRSPAGSGAAVGSGLALDRHRLAARLGFAAPSDNSLDAVADRDYAIELVSAVAVAMGHLSRLAGELVLWSTPYVGFVRLADGYASGSSMLPNKRNPDSAELIRARAARVSADLATLLSLTSGLPLAYHRDLQETRRAMFDAVASLQLCGEVLTGAVNTLEFNRDAMRQAAARGHALATALAERLVRAGVPFRAAHQRVGRLVADAEQAGCDLAQLPDGALREALPELAELTTVMPTLEEAVAAADVHGGTAPHRVRAALQLAQERLAAR